MTLCRLAALLIATLPLLLFIPEAEAQRVKARPSVSVFFSPEVATTRLLGAPQAQSSWSFGGHLRQGIVFGPMVTWLRVGGDAWLTYQEGPPLQRGLRGFNTGVGLGLQHRFSVLRVAGFAEYNAVNLAGNPLHDSLGERTLFHTLGGGAALALTSLSPLFVELRGSAHHWFGTAHATQSVQVLLSIGVEARLRR